MCGGGGACWLADCLRADRRHRSIPSNLLAHLHTLAAQSGWLKSALREEFFAQCWGCRSSPDHACR